MFNHFLTTHTSIISTKNLLKRALEEAVEDLVISRDSHATAATALRSRLSEVEASIEASERAASEARADARATESRMSAMMARMGHGEWNNSCEWGSSSGEWGSGIASRAAHERVEHLEAHVKRLSRSLREAERFAFEQHARAVALKAKQRRRRTQSGGGDGGSCGHVGEYKDESSSGSSDDDSAGDGSEGKSKVNVGLRTRTIKEL